MTPSRATIVPIAAAPTETVTEDNYFFKLSAFHGSTAGILRSKPEFIQPDARRNEVISFREAAA